jgi:hypothetical protein
MHVAPNLATCHRAQELIFLSVTVSKFPGSSAVVLAAIEEDAVICMKGYYGPFYLNENESEPCAVLRSRTFRRDQSVDWS